MFNILYNTYINNINNFYIIRKQIEYTEDQCQGKFKYLLLCYKKKLDNRHKTGSANYEFDYFDELDGLFGRKPNIKSKYLASSSRIYNG